jgi:hypothetical protein
MTENAGERSFADIEVTITGRHGPSSWDAQVELSGDARQGKPVLLRTSGDVEFRAGDRRRILDAAITVDREDETQPVVVTLGILSETYALD